LNQTYTYGSKTWKWNGTGWKLVVPENTSPSPAGTLYTAENCGGF